MIIKEVPVNYSSLYILTLLLSCTKLSSGEKTMVVDENTEHYLIHSMGLNKKQIKDMTPSEIEEHCNKVTRKEIDDMGMSKSESLS